MNFKKRITAVLLALALGAGLAGCASSGGATAVLLEDGWKTRADADNTGEGAGWSKGFEEDDADATDASVIWYSNTFDCAFSMGGSDRAVLTLADAGENVKAWLNGKEAGSFESAAGFTRIDVTDSLKKSGSNTLVIRCEGGEQVGAASISVRPQAFVSDLYATADPATGEVVFVAEVDNGGAERMLPIEATLTAIDTGKVLVRISDTVSVPAGKSVQTVKMTVTGFTEWNTVNPYLYKAQLLLDSTDTSSAYVGFRSFSVDDGGFFTLNGERIILKCAEIPDEVLSDEIAMRAFVDYARVCGFNSVRPSGMPATQALMAYADKVGMLVETRASGTDAAALAVSASACGASVRAHASGVLLGLELNDKPADKSQAAEALKGVRSLGCNAVVMCGGARENGDAVDISISGNSFDKSIKNYVRVVPKAELPSGDYAAIEDWFRSGGLDKTYVDAAAAYKAAQISYVAAAESQIRALRAGTEICGICFAGNLADRPETMLDIISDGLNNLRFCIMTPDEATAGQSTAVEIKLSNYDTLWPNEFTVLVKVTGVNGTVFEKSVPVTVEAGADGRCAQIFDVLAEDIEIADEGEYIISAEFTNLAHPVCGEKTLTVTGAAQ